MRTYGKFPVGKALILTVFLSAGTVAMTQEPPVPPTEPVAVPAEATYLGTPEGGDFVVLRRRDLQIDDRVLPAFEMHLYGAVSSGGPYGAEKSGYPDFSGLGLYVPPDILIGQAREIYEPPSLDYVFGTTDGEPNAWVDGGMVHIRLRSMADDPGGLYIASIMPVRLPETASP